MKANPILERLCYAFSLLFTFIANFFDGKLLLILLKQVAVILMFLDLLGYSTDRKPPVENAYISNEEITQLIHRITHSRIDDSNRTGLILLRQSLGNLNI